MSENSEVNAVKKAVTLEMSMTRHDMLWHIAKVQEIYTEFMQSIMRDNNLLHKCASMSEMLRQLYIIKGSIDGTLYAFETYKACLNKLCANSDETNAIIDGIVNTKGE